MPNIRMGYRDCRHHVFYFLDDLSATKLPIMFLKIWLIFHLYVTVVKCQVVNPCSSNPCLNGGTCFQSVLFNSVYTCVCPPAYTGTHCKVACVYPGVQANGNALPFQAGFQIEEIITYICYANYELVGQVNLTCLGSDTWDADFPTCVKICPEITFPNTQIIDSNVTLDYANVIGDVLVWGCEDGYLLDPGQEDTQTVTRCQILGWVTETAVINCSKISCPDPGIPIGLEREGNSFLFEDVVTFSCFNADDVISSGSTSRVCQSNGRWSGSNPTCTAVSCMDPGNNILTTRTGDDTFKYGAVVMYECVEDAIKVSGSESINCQLDSTWSGEPLVCQYPATTELPTDLVATTNLTAVVISSVTLNVFFAVVIVMLLYRFHDQLFRKSESELKTSEKSQKPVNACHVFEKNAAYGGFNEDVQQPIYLEVTE